MIKVKRIKNKTKLQMEGNLLELMVDAALTLQAMRKTIAKDDEYSGVVFARVICDIASDGVLFDEENITENVIKRVMTIVDGLKAADSAEEDDEE